MTRPLSTSRPRVWWLAIRPRTLPAAVGPVLVGLGVGIAEGGWHPVAAVACLAVALLLQVGANLANDLFDHRSGADGADRVGPTRAAASGLLSERELALATALCLLAAAVCGLVLVAIGGPVLLVLGALAIVAAVAYTGGPLPYGYRGMGEIAVFTFFGLVAVAGTAYLQTGAWSALGFTAAITPGCLVTAILVVNNLRDIGPDSRAGKRTLAVIRGAGFARREYLALLTVAYLVPPLLWIGGLASWTVALPLLTIPLAVSLVRAVWQDGDPRQLNPVLGATAQLQLVVSMLFAIGLALGRAVGTS